MLRHVACFFLLGGLFILMTAHAQKSENLSLYLTPKCIFSPHGQITRFSSTTDSSMSLRGLRTIAYCN
jgi:hypothetical protein